VSEPGGFVAAGEVAVYAFGRAQEFVGVAEGHGVAVAVVAPVVVVVAAAVAAVSAAVAVAVSA
jgi:hypothetical protein